MTQSIEKTAVQSLVSACDIADNDVLIIHSAFAGLSHAGFRVEKFIEALLDAVDRLTLLMPAMTWRTVTPEQPCFDELETPSHVGVLTEVFRRDYATARSIHPTHSAAACGPRAGALTTGHQEGITPCPPHSPFGRLAGVGAGILLLGAEFESCTAIHCWEEEVAPDYYLRPLDTSAVYACKDRHGEVHRVLARRHYRLDRNFNKFGPMLAERKELVSGDMAGTHWQFCRATALQALVREVLQRDPTGTVG